MVRAAAFAVPGDLATPTGGYTYDRRIIGELGVAGWQIQVVDLGEGFPHVDTAARGRAIERIAALPGELPVVVDGLAFGVLDAPALAHSHWLIALVHHPLALESGLSEEQAAALRASERAALASTRHVIASSPSTARLLVADYAVAADRISIVPPGTDRVPITPRMRGSTVELLAVGSVVPRKGYDILLAALTKIRDLSWRLVVAGDRTRDAATPRMLDARILRLGLEERITFAGAVTARALHQLYANADLFVLPSRFEGYGMAYAEAIAHGVPVVGTRVSAIPETVPPGAGVLVPPEDADALAATLRDLIEEPARLAELAGGARAAAPTFPTWPDSAALFARVLERTA